MSQMHKLKAYFGMVPMDDEHYADGDYADADGRELDGRDRVEGSYGAEPASRRTPAMASAPVSAARGGYEPDRPRLEPLTARTSSRRPSSSPTRDPLAVQSERSEPRGAMNPFGEDGHPLGTITTLHPRTYNEARTIGERYRDGNPVIINLTEMSDSDARRLVDFAAGLAFAMRGAIDKVTNKVFLLSPADVDVSAEDKRRIVENGFYQHG